MPALAPARCVVIAGGGTGGHLIPGLAVARELVRLGVERIVFVGTERGIETRLVPAAGFELRLIRVGGLKNLGWRRQATALAQIPMAAWASRRILCQTGAAAVLGIGGYASGPVLLAAGLCGVPTVVFEVNARTGLANRWAGRWATRAAVNFPATARDFRRAEVTGSPVREEFFRLPETVAEPYLLAFGGSQGAQAINRAVVAMAAEVEWPIVHQTGTVDFERTEQEYQRAGLTGRVRVMPFIEDMAQAMAGAGLVICRSGASTLGELAGGRAAILIPFPGAADQHQLRNAEAYRDAGAAVLIEQRDLTAAKLAETVRELIAAPERRLAMQRAAKGFAHPDAARQIAAMVLQAARQK